MGAFDYTTNGVTMPAHSCMTPWGAGEWIARADQGEGRAGRDTVGTG